jgi:hypothetical protein
MLTKLNKAAVLFLFAIFVIGPAQAEPNNTKSFSYGIYSSSEGMAKVDKEEVRKSLPPPPPLDPKRSKDPKYVAEMWWQHLGYNSKEEAAEMLEEEKRHIEEGGFPFPWAPPFPGNPNAEPDDYFTMPEDEALGNCTYVKGYSFPDLCHDSNNKLIFNSEIDGQEVLDAIAKRQGRFGKYNKIPKDHKQHIEELKKTIKYISKPDYSEKVILPLTE